jgi:hypothetical protein
MADRDPFGPGSREKNGKNTIKNSIRKLAAKRAQAKNLKSEAASNRMNMQTAKGKEYAMTGGVRQNERSSMGGVLPFVERTENVRALRGFTQKEQQLMAQMTPKARTSYLKSKKLDKMDTKAFEKGRSSVTKTDKGSGRTGGMRLGGLGALRGGGAGFPRVR